MQAQVQAQVQARARVCPYVKIEAAAPNLVLTALRRALRSQSLGMGACCFRDLGVNKSNTRDILT